MIRLLKSSLKFENEVLIVYDSVDDSSVEEAKKLENELDNVRAIHNSNKKELNTLSIKEFRSQFMIYF